MPSTFEKEVDKMMKKKGVWLNKRISFWTKQPDAERKLKANTLLIDALYLLSEEKYVKSYIIIKLFERIIKPNELDKFVVMYSYIWAKISKHAGDSESMLKFTIQGLLNIGNKEHHLKVNFQAFVNDLHICSDCKSDIKSILKQGKKHRK